MCCSIECTSIRTKFGFISLLLLGAVNCKRHSRLFYDSQPQLSVYQHEIISLSQTLVHHRHRAAAYPALAFSSKTSPDLAAQSCVVQISLRWVESGCWQPETQSCWVVTLWRIRGWRDGVVVTEQEREGWGEKKIKGGWREAWRWGLTKQSVTCWSETAW